ncbi:hypothetical protein DFH05DRAFT_1457428 [Lentinula detonsa]|uniref:Uncharacterized protein n=1 Tax=Lentinula detonsa TaxID=2804962 RepID=A0A9W8P9L1_9AGAR|nr:hypothetical protein DFH05DRAFT_1457428 [Lentinula detonsa]
MSNSCLNTSGKLGPLLPATCSNSVAYVQQAFKHLLEYKFAVLYLRFGYGALKLLAKSGDLLFELPFGYGALKLLAKSGDLLFDLPFGYGALKLLAKSGDLLFDLPTLVEDLIKLVSFSSWYIFLVNTENKYLRTRHYFSGKILELTFRHSSKKLFYDKLTKLITTQRKFPIYKSERSEEQKIADKAKTRYNNPEKDAKRLAQKRKEMTDEERLTEQTNKRKYNANYYLKHREAILAKQQRKRTSRYIAKHGERAFWLRHSHREVAFQK